MGMMASRHLHKEAFCLMLYRGVESGEEEWLWNSRDGVTPFIIWSAKDGVVIDVLVVMG